MKYKSFNLTNFIGLKYFKPESIAEIKGENEKYKRLKKKEALKQTHAKITTRYCAKCKSKCEINAENYVYSYSEKKKEYRKLFLCENCLMKCKSCNKTSNPGIFVYIWNKTKSDYNKLFYCMDCYKKANLNQCANCKKRIDSDIIINDISYCVVCNKGMEESKIPIKISGMLDNIPDNDNQSKVTLNQAVKSLYVPIVKYKPGGDKFWERFNFTYKVYKEQWYYDNEKIKRSGRLIGLDGPIVSYEPRNSFSDDEKELGEYRLFLASFKLLTPEEFANAFGQEIKNKPGLPGGGRCKHCDKEDCNGNCRKRQKKEKTSEAEFAVLQQTSVDVSNTKCQSEEGDQYSYSESSNYELNIDNEIYKAYRRNLNRVNQVNPDFSLQEIPRKGGFRYLLQQLAAYKGTLGGDTLQTPFGIAHIEYNHGKESIDKHVKNPKPNKYEYIGPAIDKVLNKDAFSKFYKIILDYLTTLANDIYAGKKLSDIDVPKSDFFEKKEYFKLDAVEDDIIKAKKAATSLCAAFMVSESSRNRLFDGGKMGRTLYRTNVDENVTQKMKRFPPSVKGGSDFGREARNNSDFLDLSWEDLNGNASPNSEDESFNIEAAKNELESIIRDKIDKFLEKATISDLQQVVSIVKKY